MLWNLLAFSRWPGYPRLVYRGWIGYWLDFGLLGFLFRCFAQLLFYFLFGLLLWYFGFLVLNWCFCCIFGWFGCLTLLLFFFVLHFFLRLLLIIMNCKHLIVLNAIFEEFDSHLLVEGLVLAGECLDERFDVGDQAGFECFIEGGVGFILSEVEHIVDILY